MDQLQVQTGNERLKRLMLSLAKPEKWKATEELAAASLRAYAADERLARVDTVIIIGHGTSLATAMNAEFLFSSHFTYLLSVLWSPFTSSLLSPDLQEQKKEPF